MSGKREHSRPTRRSDSEAPFGGASASRSADTFFDLAPRPARYGGASDDEAAREEWRVFERRSTFMLLAFAAVLVVVCLRLVYLQCFRHDALTAEGTQRRTVTIELPARRGTIYDCKGKVLAMDVECRAICCNPKDVEVPYQIANILERHLGGSAEDYAEKMFVDSQFACLARQVSLSDTEAIFDELDKAGIVGLYTEVDMKREYPFGKVGSQIIGVIPDEENGIVGSGLEYQYDELLSGEPGSKTIETGVYSPIAGVEAEVKDPKDGADIVISVDINVQAVAEEKIVEGVSEYNAESGSVMVIDPRTGEIRAACSTPLFDLTDRSVVEEGATSIKLVSSAYEPGSIFKVLTACIALESAQVSPTQEFYVPWTVQVGDDWVTDDDDRTVDMIMDLREILRRSSNAGAATIAQDYIGADTFAQGVEDFGIGQLTGIDYPGEVVGFVRARSEYDGSSLGSMSFGQGVSVPLVQMVRAVGAVANDGVATTPHFLVSAGGVRREWPEGVQVVSSQTAHMVVDMMRTVVESGTAEDAKVEHYDIAGKTGTGEIADTEKGGYKENSYTSSLIGFAQASDPAVLVYVGLNGTSHLAATSAAPLFSSIMSEALTDMGVIPTY